MQNLNSIIHSIHSQHKAVIPTLKKSHCYEMLAAYSGFKTYAAYKQSLNKLTLPKEPALQNMALCFSRAISLGFSESEVNVLCEAIESSFTPNDQARLQFERLYAALINNDEDYVDLPKNLILFITELVKFGLPESYLLAAVICHDVITDFYDHRDNRQAKYWFDKRAAGQKLNRLQTEVADSYANVKDYFDLVVLLDEQLSIFTIPSPLSAQKISQWLKYSSDKVWTQAFNEQPDLVLIAFEQLTQEHLLSLSEINQKALQQWKLAEALLHPYRGRIQSEIHKSTSPDQVWFWHLYGLANGVDATRDDLYAINADTGEDYDDYGPIAFEGTEGVVLPAITDQKKSELELFVSSIVHHS